LEHLYVVLNNAIGLNMSQNKQWLFGWNESAYI